MKKNLISTLMGGAKLDTALRLITKKGKRFKPWVLMLIMFAGFLTQGRSQHKCGFDDYMHPLIQQNPQYYNNWFRDKFNMFQRESSRGGNVVIPVVFHVIYHDSPSNIPNAQILAAFNGLNADFNGSGIQFCLAKRDADGNAMSEEGVKRVDGTTIGYSGNMTIGGNEAAVKGLSYFSNMRYLNVWIVSDITIAGVSGNILGIGYFPNSVSRNLDGIVMDRNYFGQGNWHVLTHEAGHYLGLFHTFEGDDPDYNGMNFVCPSLDPVLGDHIEDTQAHIRSANGTCPTGPNPCYAGQITVPNLADISNNHMDYSDETCRTQFTADQVTLMKATLMQERASLSASLGCVEVCNEPWTVDYTQTPGGIIPVGVNATFNGTITPGQNYNQQWYFDGLNLYSGSSAFLYASSPKTIEVCYRVNNNNCVKEKCREVIIGSVYGCVPNIDQCNLLINGDFSQVNPVHTNTSTPFSYFDYPQAPTADILCNWVNTFQTPTGIKLANDEIACMMYAYSATAGVFNPLSSDILTTLNPLNLLDGIEYKVTMDVRSFKPCSGAGTKAKLEVGFTDSYDDFTNAQVKYLSNDLPSDCFDNTQVQLANINYVPISFTFTYNPTMGKHLFFRSVDTDGPSLSVKNIKVKSCCPKPRIVAEKLTSCQYRFNFENDGDDADLYWEVSTGQSGNSTGTLVNFPSNGTYQVCLYMTCDGGNNVISECIDVVVTDCVNGCQYGYISPLGASIQLCEEENFQLNVSIPIPPGFAPCGPELYIYPEAEVSNVNFYFDETGSTNYLHISVSVGDPNAFYTAVLCGPNGTIGCFQFATGPLSATKCDECPPEPIKIEMTCNDSNPSDTHFSYNGNISVDPGLNYVPCGSASTSSGYTQGAPVPGAGGYSIPINVVTNNPNPPNSTVVLCFYNEFTDKYKCFTVVLSFPEPCKIITCLEMQSPPLECKNAIAGNANYSYNISMFGMMAANGYTLCPAAVYSNIGIATVKNPIPGRDPIINLSIPCADLERYGEVVLTINFCKGDEIICYSITIPLIACGDCRYFEYRSKEGTYQVYPNPTSKILYVDSGSNNKGQDVSLFDMYGRLILSRPLEKGTNRVPLVGILNGIYYVIIQDGTETHRQKIIITE